MFSSIRAKVILFYLAVLLFLLSALGIFLFLTIHRVVFNTIDSELRSRAEDLAMLISSDVGETSPDFPAEVMQEYNFQKSKNYFQIRLLDGTTLEKSASLKDRQLPPPEKTDPMLIRTIAFHGLPVRLINFHLTKATKKTYKGEPVDHLIIQCAKDISDQMILLKKFNLIIAFSIFSILAISALGGFIIAKKALTPVKEITKTIDQISESNLSERITLDDIPAELKALAFSFNQTFDHLEKSFNRQKQFAADASHELRTPLSVIVSQCEITLRRLRSSDEYQKALTTVMQAAALMSDVIGKLLTITRLEIDQKNLKIEWLNLEDIIRESIKLLSSLAEQKGIIIQNGFQESVDLYGDRALLVELFTNLIENAIKYNRPQGRIMISVKEESPWMVCQIEDNGIGIPGQDLERVFDRFYRVDKSRSKEIGGSGLGLGICKEIVQLHGGKIQLKSINKIGTIVSVFLPKAITVPDPERPF